MLLLLFGLHLRAVAAARVLLSHGLPQAFCMALLVIYGMIIVASPGFDW